MVRVREFEESDRKAVPSIVGPLYAEPAGPPTLTVTHDGKPVGFAWFSTNDDVTAYITLALAETAHRYGTAVAPMLLEYGFDILDMSRLATTVVADNEPAARLARKWGKPEGLLRDAFRDADGNHHDVLVYALLRREWKE